MSNRYSILDQRGLNYFTLTVAGWVDIFSRKRYRDIIIESLKHCIAHQGLHVYGYVIMTNHIHLIASASGDQTLSDVIGNFKSFTAKEILKSIQARPESRKEWLMYLFKYFAKDLPKKQHRFWKADNHPINLYSRRVIVQKLDYLPVRQAGIHNNPVRAGWVRLPKHYIYSSASNYLDQGRGILQVELLEEYYTPHWLW